MAQNYQLLRFVPHNLTTQFALPIEPPPPVMNAVWFVSRWPTATVSVTTDSRRNRSSISTLRRLGNAGSAIQQFVPHAGNDLGFLTSADSHTRAISRMDLPGAVGMAMITWSICSDAIKRGMASVHRVPGCRRCLHCVCWDCRPENRPTCIDNVSELRISRQS